MRPTWNILGLSDWIEQMNVLRSKSFARLRDLALAWLVAPAPQLITTALVYSGLSSTHHSSFYRLFSDTPWKPDEMCHAVFDALLESFVGDDELVQLLVDDTLTHHNGDHIDALGCHIDPVRSSRTYKVKAFGHVWVIAAICLRFPFSPRDFALPIAFRLYRTQAECEASGEFFRTKTALAEELMSMVSGWLKGRRAVLCADSAYMCEQMLKNRPVHIEMIGSLKSNVVLRTSTPKKTGKAGRPRYQGYRLPKPAEMYRDEAYPWQEADVAMYRGVRRVCFKTVCAQWYQPNGPRLMRVVLVKMTSGSDDFRLYASTDPERDATEVLRLYARRWSQEVTHRDLKQELGFGASAVRHPNSVFRLPVFVGLLYSTTVAWYADHGCGSVHDRIPFRPWYTKKAAPAFADISATARQAIRAHGVFQECEQHDFPRILTPPWHPYTPPGRDRHRTTGTEQRHAEENKVA